MKNTFYPLIMILLSLACRKLPVSTSITGDYYRSFTNDNGTIGVSNELMLFSDNTFFYIENGNSEWGGKCEGKWEYIKRDEIRLNNFYDDPLLSVIGMGYISQRQIDVEIINDNEINSTLSN